MAQGFRVGRALGGTMLASSLLLLLLLAGCGKDDPDDGGPPPPAAVAPTISAQPANQTVTAGQPATFTVTAGGTAPLTYQWQRDSVPIQSATGSSYTLGTTASGDNGARFRVIVINAAGTVTSSDATLTVTTPAPPGTTAITTTGGSVSSENGNLTVQVPAGVLLGETFFKVVPVATIAGLPAGYTVRSGSTFEITWTGAGLSAGAVVLLRFPRSVTGTGALQVSASALRPAVRPATTAPQPGAVVQCGDTTQIYGMQEDPNASSYANAGVILCGPLPGGGGSQTSTSTVGVVQPPAGAYPAITRQPVAVTTASGDTATFSVQATGTQLEYQWIRDGVRIPGANQPTYLLDTQAADSGAMFSVEVANVLGAVVSNSVLLTVNAPAPPPAPLFHDTVVVTPYAVGTGIPDVDSGGVGLLNMVYDSVGQLGADLQSIHGKFLPLRSRPRLLGGPNVLQTYVVFIDDDGSSSCGPGTGNRLSAISVRRYVEQGPLPPSDRFTLYQSASQCIVNFAAAKVPDAVNGIHAVAFAIRESDGAMKVGLGGAKSPGPFINGMQEPPLTWVPTTPSVAPLQTSPECANGGFDSAGMMGVSQAVYTNGLSPIQATLAYVSGGGSSAVTCVTTLSGGIWKPAEKLFDRALDAEPVAVIDGNGNSIVMASVVVDPAASAPTYEMTAAYSAAGSGVWTSTVLDTSDAPALPSVAIDFYGYATAVWRPNSSSGRSIVYTSRRGLAGTWSAAKALSAADAIETRYPRICVGASGKAMAVFEQNFQAGAPFTVYGRLWSGGAWSDISRIQLGDADGRFGDCPRNGDPGWPGGFFVTWREANPADVSQFRIVQREYIPR